MLHRQFILSMIHMDEKNVSETAPVTTVFQDGYVPSSTEKKRAVMMYFLMGIIVSAFTTQKKSDFEQFHLKQALGWRATFLLLIVATMIVMFIPLIKYIPILAIVVMIIILGICIKRARAGKYTIDQQSKFAIFLGLGQWILNLFDVPQSNKNP